MPRLKDRNKQTPGGHKFYDPILKYRSRPWASIDDIAAGLIQARLGNPALTQKHGWSTDANTVRNEVDETIARHCIQMGWGSYVTLDEGVGGPNFQQPQRPQSQRFLGRAQKLRNVAAGIDIIADVGMTKDQAVSIHAAEKRASVCINCDYNELPKSWFDHFTASASEAIRKGFETFKGWNLPVPHKDKIGICERCDCPMGLKVYFPLNKIINNMPPDVFDSLPEWCWIRKESNGIH